MGLNLDKGVDNKENNKILRNASIAEIGALLGITDPAQLNAEGINQAYKKAARALHPDRNKDNTEGAAMAFNLFSGVRNFLETELGISASKGNDPDPKETTENTKQGGKPATSASLQSFVSAAEAMGLNLDEADSDRNKGILKGKSLEELGALVGVSNPDQLDAKGIGEALEKAKEAFDPENNIGNEQMATAAKLLFFSAFDALTDALVKERGAEEEVEEELEEEEEVEEEKESEKKEEKDDNDKEEEVNDGPEADSLEEGEQKKEGIETEFQAQAIEQPTNPNQPIYLGEKSESLFAKLLKALKSLITAPFKAVISLFDTQDKENKKLTPETLPTSQHREEVVDKKIPKDLMQTLSGLGLENHEEKHGKISSTALSSYSPPKEQEESASR